MIEKYRSNTQCSSLWCRDSPDLPGIPTSIDDDKPIPGLRFWNQVQYIHENEISGPFHGEQFWEAFLFGTGKVSGAVAAVIDCCLNFSGNVWQVMIKS